MVTRSTPPSVLQSAARHSGQPFPAPRLPVEHSEKKKKNPKVLVPRISINCHHQLLLFLLSTFRQSTILPSYNFLSTIKDVTKTQSGQNCSTVNSCKDNMKCTEPSSM